MKVAAVVTSYVVVLDSDFQIHGEFCTNLDGFNPSVIYGWKDDEVYFHMQLMAHRLELCRLSYPYFREHWSRTLLLSNWAKTNPFSGGMFLV